MVESSKDVSSSKKATKVSLSALAHGKQQDRIWQTMFSGLLILVLFYRSRSNITVRLRGRPQKF